MDRTLHAISREGVAVLGPTRIVVVGASAARIDALSKLVAALPADVDAPLVIAQHLDPRRASHLADILKRQGVLPVHVAEQGMQLEDGVAFVIPPNRNGRSSVQPPLILDPFSRVA